MYSAFVYLLLVGALFAFVGAQTTTEPVTGILGNATVVEDNPPGLIYTATLPTKQFFNPEDPRGNIKGSVSATANPNGIGVSFNVNFENLPTSGGPFLYHLHVAPVPEDGNCTKTLGHLDPFVRGETPACDPNLPQTCQVGDLSGKNGKITSDIFVTAYQDNFASTLEGLGSFFGNRSIVVHFANKTRITCANFTLVGSTVGGGNYTTPNATSTGGPIPFTGASAKTMIPSFALLMAGALALVL